MNHKHVEMMNKVQPINCDKFIIGTSAELIETIK